MREITSRDMLRGDLELLILSTLAEGDKYGYLILQTLSERSQGAVSIQAGTLYPLLHKLEAEKFVRSRWDDTTGRRRKWYELTAAGKRYYARRVEQWNEYTECVRRMLAPAAG